jgi:hypothetical protein
MEYILIIFVAGVLCGVYGAFLYRKIKGDKK